MIKIPLSQRNIIFNSSWTGRAIKLEINEPKSISLKNLERFQSLKMPLPHFISFSSTLSLTQSCGEAMILHGHRRRIFLPRLAMGLTSIRTHKF